MSRSEVSVIICGENGVGKSSLCFRLMHNVIVDNYDPTIEDCFRKPMTVDNKEYIVNLLDTSSSEIDSGYFWAMNSRMYQLNDGIILVYSIANRQSFEQLKRWKEGIAQLKRKVWDDRKFPFFIVGNKCDLEESREISTEEGEEAAAEFGFKFFETSARTGLNVYELLVEFIKQSKKEMLNDLTTKIVQKKPKQKLCFLM